MNFRGTSGKIQLKTEKQNVLRTDGRKRFVEEEMEGVGRVRHSRVRWERSDAETAGTESSRYSFLKHSKV